MSENECPNGLILDHFPQDLSQAEALAPILEEMGIELDVVITLVMDEDELFERVTGRRVHLESGRTYHTVYNPPIVEGIDDITGESLSIRDEDSAEIYP